MKNLILKTNSVLLLLAIWWLVFVAFSITNINPFQILNIFGFITLIILPGFLTIMTLQVKRLEWWGYVSLSVGLSLFEMIGVGLLGNNLLPLVGVNEPLAKEVLLLEFSIFIFILILIARSNTRKININIRKYIIFENFDDAALAVLPAIFVLFSVTGAIRLNNGGDGIIIFFMLIGIAIYSIILTTKSKNTGPNVIPTALFFISLSMLFMTSLRGEYITGHDIQREYRVFNLTQNNGIWSIASFRDAYNACMSITILPVFIYDLLDFPKFDIYKIYFQIIFAIVPSVIFLMVRRYTTSAIAFLSAFYFISFPTFFTDMPMLNRQEIAFLFMILMAYIIFEYNLSLPSRRTLFIIFGLGMALSHYSTTYTFVAILIFLLYAHPIARMAKIYIHRKKGFPNFFIGKIRNNPHQKIDSRINKRMVVFLIAASFIWSSVLTDTSSNSLIRVFSETVKVIFNSGSEDSRSGDVFYSLFSLKKFDAETEFKNYYEKFIPQTRAKDPEAFYDKSLYEKYILKTTYEDTVPLTPIGEFLEEKGIDSRNLNYNLKQMSAKLLQLLIIIGFIFIAVNRKFIRKSIDPEFLLLAEGSLFLVAIQIALPILSIEYGVLRAFQQALFFLGIFAILGSCAVAGKFKASTQMKFASLLTFGFFLSSTGVVVYLTGGYEPQIHLYSSGKYYDIYYLHNSEIAGINWLENKIKIAGGYYQSEVQSDRYLPLETEYAENVDMQNDIHPGLIRKDSYVFLGFNNINNERSTALYKGNLITYNYPINFLEENKNLLYSSGGVKIYK